MNMKISFHSNYGQGSEFTIEIPILKRLTINKLTPRLVINEVEAKGNEIPPLYEESMMSFRVSCNNNYCT